MKKFKVKNTGLLPNSLKIISSCIRTVSTNASTVVRSAGASVAASIAASADDQRDQVIWAGFDRLEIGPASFRHVLLLGYQTGFQVIDVEDASDFTELVSKRDAPVTFLQLLHLPTKFDANEKFLQLHPLLMVVAGDEPTRSGLGQNRTYLSQPGRDGSVMAQSGSLVDSPTAVRFYSLKSNCYVKVLRFRSTVFMVRCSPLIVCIGLEKEIHCLDAVTLEHKFTVPTYPVPRSGGQGMVGVNFGYGPLAVGPRWLAYASNKLLVSNTGHLSPKNLTPGISPSTSPSNGSLVARYAMESSKQLAAGIITLGDKGYKTISKYYPDMLQDRPISPANSNPNWKVKNSSSEVDNAGMVIVKDVISNTVISQFRAHSSPLSALCFDPSGTLLVTASIHGNNVNIFRIMPCTRNTSSNQIHDWNSSHVLLYKLHRGITSAVIQDISFSCYCQWISIVSSKGTCHVFALSPFGGETGYRFQRSHSRAVNPVQSLPWWSTPSFVIDEQPLPPPHPLTLSVVGRIKNNNSGFLNSVSNTASFLGKTSILSGSVASVFHNSTTYRNQNMSKKVNSLEYLLVYTPSGYVVQYELLPSVGVQQIDVGSQTQPGQDDELGLIFEPCQWWQVSRRLDFPEREECISATSIYNVCVGGQKLVENDSVKQNDRAHLFLSNAEVQINSGRLPLWQNAKVHFYVMKSANVEGFADGEALIENIPCYEVDIRRKDLLPVFDHFNSIKSGWDDRAYSARKNPGESGDESVICLSKPASVSFTESSDGERVRITASTRLNPLKNYMDMKVWILLLLLCCNCSCSGSSRQVIKGENDVVWIVQLSDLHFSVHHPERASDFQEYVTRTLSMLNPSLVLITGDLTDGKSKDHLTMKQNEQEWVEYQKTMENVITKSGLDRSIFYDLRGNHDNFGLPTAFDFFSNYSITAQLGRSQSVNTVTLQTSTRNVVFVSFDTTMSTGLRGPTNLFGHPTDQLLTDLNSHLSRWDSTSSTKITFGHFPLSFSAPTSSKNNLQQIFLNQSVTAYLCGHLHSRFGKNLKRHHQETDSSNLIQLNMHPKGTSKKVNDFWELEMGDWRKTRAIRLLAIDKGRVSFLDTDLKTGSKEILILPTYPLDSRYMLNKYKFQSTEDASHIRALVFSSAIIASVKVKIYDSSHRDMVVLEVSMSKNDNLYTAPWNSEAFVDPSPSRYWLEIQAVDNNGVTVSTELMPFSLNGLRADLSWTWKEFFVMGCQWAELYYPIFWSFYLFVFIILILPKIIISVSKKHYTYKYFKANKGVINGLTWVFAELDSIPFLWNLMLAYLLYLVLCPWISGQVFSNGGHSDRGYMTYKGWVVNFDDLKSLEFIGFPDIMVIVIPHIYFVVLPAVVIIGALAAERAVYQDHVCSLSGKKRDDDDDGESRSKDHNVSGWMLRKWARGILVIFSLAVCWKHFKNCWALMKAYEMNPLVHFPFYSFSIPLLLAYAFYKAKRL